MEEEKNFTLTTFAKKLRLRRRELHLTQEKLAEKADLAWGYLGEIERGKKNPSIVTAMVLAKALNVSLEYFTDEMIKERANSYHTDHHGYLVKENPHEYLQKHSSQKIKSRDTSEHLLNFYQAFSKAIALASLVQSEVPRIAIISHLTTLGLNYLKAYEANNIKDFSKEIKARSEALKEIFNNLNDKKLTERIVSSIYQMNLLIVSSEKNI